MIFWAEVKRTNTQHTMLGHSRRSIQPTMMMYADVNAREISWMNRIMKYARNEF